jgi:hypothetical protein
MLKHPPPAFASAAPQVTQPWKQDVLIKKSWKTLHQYRSALASFMRFASGAT